LVILLAIVLTFVRFAAAAPENCFCLSLQSFTYIRSSPKPALRFVAWICSNNIHRSSNLEAGNKQIFFPKLQEDTRRHLACSGYGKLGLANIENEKALGYIIGVGGNKDELR
jgi:hypothetical protein